ncbi:hypothetical protein EYF80_044139 [Liparis tanakae]|uniref:Uncharacterized protein n=1 Tax=Liparis tanakae TaxID=230148 RepID=A0A4Z2FXE9_9TELE|nr:hypothetical protein EYF80_044139 [Liparis tanakae]
MCSFTPCPHSAGSGEAQRNRREAGTIAWCSCIGEKAREEATLRDDMSEKDTATEKILTGNRARA